MNADTELTGPGHSLAELCVLANLPPRTVRYYIQIGLLDRPQGETRAARYGAAHLEQLQLIRKWTAAGLSLDRIRDLVRGEPAPVPPRPRAIGAIDVRSHLLVADGVELVIEPGRAGLSQERVRRFVKAVMAAFAQVGGEETGPDASGQERRGASTREEAILATELTPEAPKRRRDGIDGTAND